MIDQKVLVLDGLAPDSFSSNGSGPANASSDISGQSQQPVADTLRQLNYDVIQFETPESLFIQLHSIKDTTAVVILIDFNTPYRNGLDVLDEMNDRGISLPVINTILESDVPAIVSAMRKGAISVLEKPIDIAELQRSLSTAFCHSVQLRRRVRANKNEFYKTRKRLAQLTNRERQIVEGILGDLSNAEIAEEFSISIKTVELYRSKAMSKLEARNAAHLVRMVMTCEPAAPGYAAS